MTPFEYISVLISIILGLGITILLTGFAELIRRWTKVVVFVPYFVWILLVFVLHLQEWWEVYALRERTTWSLLLFLFVISYPIVLFILANLFYPNQWPEDGIDLKAYYFANCRKFFALVCLLSLISILQNHFLAGYSLRDQLLQGGVFVLFLWMFLFTPRNEKVHTGIAILLVVVLVGSFAWRPDQLNLR